MRARHIWVVAALAAALVGCSSGEEEPAAPADKAGAQQVVDAIAPEWPLPNPRDTSSGCKAREGDTGPGCASRVTTDAVTVTEWPDEETAARAAKLGKANGAQRAGRYVLTWVGDQDLTSDEARADMVRIAKAQS